MKKLLTIVLVLMLAILPIVSVSAELAKGSTGDAVSAMQEKLNALGYTLTADGDYGPGTEEAIRNFQTASGLEATGSADDATLTAIDAAYDTLMGPILGKSLTTGIDTRTAYKPVVVQIDNDPKARAQYGVGSADVIYEVLIDRDWCTRYTAVFNDTYPEKVGDVRSARLVNIDLYKDWDGAFVHVGGQIATDTIDTNVKHYVDSMRITARYDGNSDSKHFSYDSDRARGYDEMVNAALVASEDYTAVEKSPLMFSADAPTMKGESVNEFSMTYTRVCNPSYTFNAETGLYDRFYNGEAFTDKATGEQVSYANVIVMWAENSWVNSDGERPYYNILDSTNKCDYFIGGYHFTGTWTRGDEESSTVYSDDEGNVVSFKPGKTFIQVLPLNKELTLGPATTAAE